VEAFIHGLLPPPQQQLSAVVQQPPLSACRFGLWRRPAVGALSATPVACAFVPGLMCSVAAVAARVFVCRLRRWCGGKAAAAAAHNLGNFQVYFSLLSESTVCS
jgi:hypothetical protein